MQVIDHILMDLIGLVPDISYLQHVFLGVGVIIYEIIRQSDEGAIKEHTPGGFRHRWHTVNF